MEKYIDLLRLIIKNFNIDNNNEFDDIKKYIINKIFDEYYHHRNKIFDNEYNQNKNSCCIDNLYKKYNIRYFDLQENIVL